MLLCVEQNMMGRVLKVPVGRSGEGWLHPASYSQVSLSCRSAPLISEVRERWLDSRAAK